MCRADRKALRANERVLPDKKQQQPIERSLKHTEGNLRLAENGNN
jgi:hypothetical protein